MPFSFVYYHSYYSHYLQYMLKIMLLRIASPDNGLIECFPYSSKKFEVFQLPSILFLPTMIKNCAKAEITYLSNSLYFSNNNEFPKNSKTFFL